MIAMMMVATHAQTLCKTNRTECQLGVYVPDIYNDCWLVCMCREELYSGQSEEMMQFDNDYDGDDDKVDDVPMFDYNIDSSEQMDEHMAALVLTSLSCSPASPACMPGAS